MNEIEIITEYNALKARAKSVQLTLSPDYPNGKFNIDDAPEADGLLIFDSLHDLDKFIRGYELGYKMYKRLQAGA